MAAAAAVDAAAAIATVTATAVATAADGGIPDAKLSQAMQGPGPRQHVTC